MFKRIPKHGYIVGIFHERSSLSNIQPYFSASFPQIRGFHSFLALTYAVIKLYGSLKNLSTHSTMQSFCKILPLMLFSHKSIQKKDKSRTNRHGWKIHFVP